MYVCYKDVECNDLNKELCMLELASLQISIRAFVHFTSLLLYIFLLIKILLYDTPLLIK